jgi:two-component system chemotaxis response regulator CheB
MVVNDSHTIREYLSDIVRSHDRFDLCGTGRDGEDALKKLPQARPDVILLDLEMPNLDGITFIDRVMASDRPIPIIVISSYGDSSDARSNIIFECLDGGAVDFVSFPALLSGWINDREKTRQDLISRIETAATANPDTLAPAGKRNTASYGPCNSSGNKVIVIGSSTGGPKVVTDIFSKLPEDLPASVMVVQHMPASFTGAFARHLASVSKIVVSEAKDGDLLRPGTAYVAPGDFHMTVTQSGAIRLDKSPKRQGVRPSANVSMVSASELFGSKTLGVLLSGMGQDGAFGMKMIKRKGGRTIAQDRATSVVFGMPKAAFDLGAVDEVVPANKIAEAIVRTLGDMEKEEMQHVR